MANVPIEPLVIVIHDCLGKVVLEALVTWEGRVREVRIREGDPMLAAPAAKTVKTWRFRPARWQGRAVSCWVSIPIVFRLH